MAPRSIFVQDFVVVDRPFERVIAVARAALRHSLLSATMSDAWETQSVALGIGRGGPFDSRSMSVDVEEPATRSSSMVVPMRWRGNVGRTLLLADLGFLRFGPDRTHLTLSGRAPVEVATSTAATSAPGGDRLLIAVVRHFLVAASVALAAAADGVATTRRLRSVDDADEPPGLARSVPSGA